MLKKKRKPYKRLLAVLMTAAMCLSMSLCSMASVSAAQTTKGEESSASDSSNTSDNSDHSDNADNSSSNNSESSSSSDDNKTNYDWSKNTTGNANLAADETIVMENGTYQLIAVTTRDDDVFYVIIDKTKTENNVYFLNEVDTADLDKLAKDDSNVSSGGEDTSEPTTAPDEEAQTTDNTDSTSSGNNQYMIYLVIGIVILDFIGNYKNNFMIPIALFGDRSYNKDNIRRYLREGSRVIPGASTIHFDSIRRKLLSFFEND